MEKLTKDFVSLRGDTFDPIHLFRELEAGLPADTSLFDVNWDSCVKFFTQCEVAEPTFNRYAIDKMAQAWLERAVDSLPKRLLEEIYFKLWISRISHSSDWKLMRYVQKCDLDSLLNDMLPIVYAAIFLHLKEAHHGKHARTIRKNSILRWMWRCMDNQGLFTISAYDNGLSATAAGKAIVWWCHDPVVIEEFRSLREAMAHVADASLIPAIIHNTLLRLVMCAAGTTVCWIPLDLCDE